MHWFEMGIGLLLALGIIAIGTSYIANPVATTRGFGLPLPEEGPNIPWWLRLKGVRDISSGFLVLTFMLWGVEREVGIILLVLALIPTGDMLLVLLARGSAKKAIGIHGLTAGVMILAAIPMISGVN